MLRTVTTVIAVLLLQSPPGAWAAAPFDGSAPLRCAIQTVMSCGEPTTFVRGTAATVNLPPALTMDVQKRLISGPATGRTVKIDSVAHDRGRLVMYGSEVGSLGVHWSVLIAESSGRMASAVVNQEGGFLMFGTCTAGKP